jgi:hypothetical protein
MKNKTIDFYFNEIINIMSNVITKLNTKLCKRHTLIGFKDLFFYLTQLIESHKTSSVTVNTDMRSSHITNASSSAFRKKRQNVPCSAFHEILMEIIHYKQKIHNELLFKKHRVFCVDVTHSPLSKELAKEGYKLTKNNTYVDSFISGIYDMYNDTCYDLYLSKNRDERSLYYEQFNLFKKDDIVVHDRGYFSYNLLYKLHSINVYPIFRMKKNYNFVKDFIKSQTNDKIIEICNKETNNTKIRLRLVKYKIEGKLYILGTTLTGKKYNIPLLKDLYKKRWSIEEYFKSIKYDLSFLNFHSKSENLIKQEIYVHLIITNLSRLIEELLKKTNSEYRKSLETNQPNFKVTIHDVTRNILPAVIFYNGSQDMKYIIDSAEALIHSVSPIRKKKRKYPRIRITPVSSWYRYHSEQELNKSSNKSSNKDSMKGSTT